MEKRFVVFGDAVPQGRPRAFRRGQFIGFYDPKESKSWKETVKWQAIQFKIHHKIDKLLETPLIMSLQFYLQRPRSLPKKVIYHTKKPDLDNLIKGIKDALKGIIYRDDSQIIHLIASKDYGSTPRVEISIKEIDGTEEIQELL